MKKIVIDGKTYSLRTSEEVTYGAEKKLERAQFEAQLAMLSDKDVSELATKAKKTGKEVNEDEFVERVMTGKIKEALLDSNEAAITPEEEAIILSADISRKDMMKMPGKVIRELAKAAQEEMGTVADFSEASETVTK